VWQNAIRIGVRLGPDAANRGYAQAFGPRLFRDLVTCFGGDLPSGSLIA
jgi:hypothetical protein